MVSIPQKGLRKGRIRAAFCPCNVCLAFVLLFQSHHNLQVIECSMSPRFLWKENRTKNPPSCFQKDEITSHVAHCVYKKPSMPVLSGASFQSARTRATGGRISVAACSPNPSGARLQDLSHSSGQAEMHPGRVPGSHPVKNSRKCLPAPAPSPQKGLPEGEQIKQSCGGRDQDSIVVIPLLVQFMKQYHGCRSNEGDPQSDEQWRLMQLHAEGSVESSNRTCQNTRFEPFWPSAAVGCKTKKEP